MQYETIVSERLLSVCVLMRQSSGVTRVGDPGAATEGVTPLFFPEKPGDIFSRQCCGVTPDFFFAKTDDLFAHLFIAFYCFHSGVTPLEGVTPHLFLPVRPRLSTILCKFAHKNVYFGCHPPGGCHPGRSAPALHLVTPLRQPIRIMSFDQ